VSVGPFAVLGLVLMASVARLCRISGITTAYEEIASRDLQGVLSTNDELLLASEFGGIGGGDDEWDEGVVIARE
jgi:ribonuclease MRP protein subunit RMP1